MINGDYSEFLDHLYFGDELYIEYQNDIFFIEGWYEEKKCIIQCTIVSSNPLQLLYETSAKTMIECAHNFLEQPLFGGKKLQEIEQQAKWVDTEQG